jgi:hypothetical protein
MAMVMFYPRLLNRLNEHVSVVPWMTSNLFNLEVGIVGVEKHFV